MQSYGKWMFLLLVNTGEVIKAVKAAIHSDEDSISG